MSFLSRMFRTDPEREALRPLYSAVIAEGRRPVWYLEGGVPDTVEGRFDVIAIVLAVVLIRLERGGDEAKRPSVLLAETFIDDMEDSLRELGVGDLVVGKRVGQLVGALGGRLGVLREGFDKDGIETAVRRNVFRDAPPSEEAVSFVAARLTALHHALGSVSLDRLVRGELPAL